MMYEVNTLMPVDYDVYTMTRKERMLYIAVASLTIYGLAFVFYRSHVFSAIICILGILYPKMKAKEIIAKRKSELNIQFKDMLYCLSSSLYAGRSVELAFKEVQNDLRLIYADPDAYIIREIELMLRKMEMNETVEAALTDFAARAHIDDISSFVDVFYICKRTGGNLVEVIKNTSNIINDKIEIKQEIDVLLAERRFEQKVLSVFPVLIIILISTTAGDYINPIFSTLQGKLVMTIAAVLLVIAFVISKRISDIKV